MDNRKVLLQELEDYRFSEVLGFLTKAAKNPVSLHSSSQKNFFQASSSQRFTQKSSASKVQNTVTAKKHPLLNVKLGKEFERLAEFKLHLSGDFGEIQLTEDCMLELQKITLPCVDPMAAMVTILVPGHSGQTDANSDHPFQVYGLKHFDLVFSREPFTVKVMAGPKLEEAFHLTLRLYC